MLITVNRAPVLTLWAAVVAERLGHPPDTALTLGRAVAGAAARVKARNIGREERRPETENLTAIHERRQCCCLARQFGCCQPTTANSERQMVIYPQTRPP